MPRSKLPFRTKLALALTLLSCVLLLVSAFRSQQKPKPASQSSKPKPARLASHVVLISVSGLSSEVWEKADAALPTLRALQKQGAHIVTLESVFPALKLPNHASLITGLPPVDHGVLSDFPFDEERGVQSLAPHQTLPAKKIDTLWQAAQREKLSTTAIGFPLTSEINSVAAIKTGGAWLNTDDAATVNQAVRALVEHRPNLLAINFASFETIARKHGAGTKEALQSLKQIDAGIQQLCAAAIQTGISAETAWVLLSDRGVARIEREFSLNLLLAQKKFLALDKAGTITSWRAAAQSLGGAAAIFARTPQDEKLVAELEKLFTEQHQKPDSPIWRVIKRSEIAKLGGDPRATLYLEAAPDWRFTDRTTGQMAAKPVEGAASGYLPTKFEMKGVLILAGKGIKSGARMEYARVIDIAPTVARLLGFELPIARGRVLQEALAP